MKKILSILLLLGFTSLSAWEDMELCDNPEIIGICEPICCYNCRLLDSFFMMPRVGYAVGKTIGVDHDYWDYGGFVIAEKEKIFLFGQGDAYRLRHEKHWAYSAGGGVRYADCCDRLWGLNAFYDYRQGCVGNFSQLGVGFETLSCCWDLRANFYLPLRSSQCSTPQVFNDYIGGYFATCSIKESGVCGGNIEFAWYFGGRCLCIESYVAIGPYFLSVFDQHTTGVRFRSGIQYRQWLRAEAVVTHDSFYNTRVQGVFTLSVPISFFCSPCQRRDCCCLPLRRVERFDIMPLNQCCNWRWNW